MHTRIPRYRHDTSESTAARLVQSLTSSDYARCQPRASRRAARHTIAITRPALVLIARPCVGALQRAAGRPTAAAATSHPPYGSEGAKVSRLAPRAVVSVCMHLTPRASRLARRPCECKCSPLVLARAHAEALWGAFSRAPWRPSPWATFGRRALGCRSTAGARCGRPLTDPSCPGPPRTRSRTSC